MGARWGSHRDGHTPSYQGEYVMDTNPLQVIGGVLVVVCVVAVVIMVVVVGFGGR